MRTDRRSVYPRGQTVDVGSYGGCVNTHDRLRSKTAGRIFTAATYLVLNKEQRGGQKGRREKVVPGIIAEDRGAEKGRLKGGQQI